MDRGWLIGGESSALKWEHSHKPKAHINNATDDSDVSQSNLAFLHAKLSSCKTTLRRWPACVQNVQEFGLEVMRPKSWLIQIMKIKGIQTSSSGDFNLLIQRPQNKMSTTLKRSQSERLNNTSLHYLIKHTYWQQWWKLIDRLAFLESRHRVSVPLRERLASSWCVDWLSLLA